MTQLLHSVAVSAFIVAPPMAVGSAHGATITVLMCGSGLGPALTIPLPQAPSDDHHCSKSCHAGCLRKRRVGCGADPL